MEEEEKNEVQIKSTINDLELQMQKLQDMQSSSHLHMQKAVDIGFLYSSPIAMNNQVYGQPRELVEFAEIGWKNELSEIKNQIAASNLPLKIMPELATRKNLIDVLNKNLSILHISCHGTSAKPQANVRPRFGQNNTTLEEAGLEHSFLIFEDLG